MDDSFRIHISSDKELDKTICSVLVDMEDRDGVNIWDMVSIPSDFASELRRWKYQTEYWLENVRLD